MKKSISIAMLLTIAVAFTTGGAASLGSCQTQYNNASSMCGMQYELDLQVADAFSSATGGLSFGSGLRNAASRRYGNCKQSAISARDNCNGNNIK